MPKPKYDLADVKSLILDFVNGNSDAIWFSCLSRSVQYVVRVIHCDSDGAIRVITDGMQKLTEKDFVRSVIVFDEIKDEYGLEGYLDHNWYIKFSISEDDGERFLDQLSFHPVERPLKLADQRVLPVTYSQED